MELSLKSELNVNTVLGQSVDIIIIIIIIIIITTHFHHVHFNDLIRHYDCYAGGN